MELNDKDLETVAGGAARTVIRYSTKESCFCCGRNKFIFYPGTGGSSVCDKCGQGQIILEWFYD